MPLSKQTNQQVLRKTNKDTKKNATSKNKSNNDIFDIRNHKGIIRASKALLEDTMNQNGKYTPEDVRTFERISRIFMQAYKIEDAKKEIRRLRRENKQLLGK